MMFEIRKADRAPLCFLIRDSAAKAAVWRPFFLGSRIEIRIVAHHVLAISLKSWPFGPPGKQPGSQRLPLHPISGPKMGERVRIEGSTEERLR